MQLSEFIWTLHSSVWVVFNNFLLIDTTDRIKISSHQKSLFFSVSLYTLFNFSRTLPLNKNVVGNFKICNKYYVAISLFFRNYMFCKFNVNSFALNLLVYLSDCAYKNSFKNHNLKISSYLHVLMAFLSFILFLMMAFWYHFYLLHV